MLKQRTLTLALALLLLVAAVTPAALAANASFVNIAAAPANALYTPLEIPGYSHTVYAFTGLEGKTQFRVYGQSGSLIGFFPVTLSAGTAYQPGGALQVALTAGADPAQDNQTTAATAVLSPTAAPVPMGFTAGGAPAIVVMENLFGQKESLAYASYDGKTFVYLPANNNLPIPGALPAVVEDMATRAKLSWENSFPVPFNLQAGFKTQARIITSDGVEATVSTAFPPIDRASLAQPQAAQPTAQPVVYQPTARPAATKRPYTSAKRTPKPAATLKPGTTATPKPLKYGVISDEVKALQTRLSALGYSVGKIDGNFGRATQKALIAFQKNNGLKGDGVAGAATLSKLSASNAVPATQTPGTVKIPLTLSVSVNKSDAQVGDTLTWTATAKGWGPGAYKFVDMLVLFNGSPLKTSKISNGESGSISITPDKAGTYAVTVTAGSSSYEVNKVTYYDNGSLSNTAAVTVAAKAQGVITKETLKLVEDIAIETKKEDDPTLEKGQEKVKQEGAVGEKIVVYSVTKTDGKETAREKTGETIVKDMVPKIILVGTKGDAPAPVITTKTETETVAIPFTTETKEDATMDKGKETVTQEGIDGEKTLTHTITLTDGKETGRTTDEKVTKAMVPKLITVGTKPVVTTETTTKTEEIPFTTVKNDDPTLPKGEEKVIVEGVNGEKTITTVITLTDGKETGRTTDAKITKDPIPKVIQVGTKEPEPPETPADDSQSNP